MNNTKLVGLVAVVAILTGGLGGYAVYKLSATPLLGGDFAGGITPSNLFTGSASGGVGNGYVTPNGSLGLLATGAIGAGGQAANNAVTEIYTATTSYPASAVTLGPISATNSATSTSIGFTAPGLSVGDACEVTYNGGPTSTAFGADAFITAANGNSVTGTATFWNGGTASTTLTVTSTATGASSTLKLTCFHTGV